MKNRKIASALASSSFFVVNYQLLISNLELHILGPKYANASGSRRRMAPLSRSDPVLRFVRSRQRFVRWGHGRMRPNRKKLSF
jgi:hypothetical protein